MKIIGWQKLLQKVEHPIDIDACKTFERISFDGSTTV